MSNLKYNYYDTNDFISLLPYSRGMTFAKTYDTDKNLLRLIKTDRWSPGIFYPDMKKDGSRYQKVGRRCKEKFSQTSLLVADFDEGWTLREALEYFKDYKYIIYPSKSHQIEKHGVIEDRFRVILFLEEKITTPYIFKKTWNKIYGSLPVDLHCNDCARFYYPCETDEIYTNPGRRVEPEIFEIEENVISAKNYFTCNRKAYYINDKLEVPETLYKLFGKMDKWLTINFCKVLLTMPGLTRETGFDIGINNLVNTLQCSEMQASRLLKKAMLSGILLLIDDRTRIGRKSRTFRANPFLRNAILNLSPAVNLKERFICDSKSALSINNINSSPFLTNTSPKKNSHYYGKSYYLTPIDKGDKLIAGKANSQLMFIANETKGIESKYWDFVNTLFGLGKNDRLEQAERIIYYYELWLRRKECGITDKLALENKKRKLRRKYSKEKYKIIKIT